MNEDRRKLLKGALNKLSDVTNVIDQVKDEEQDYFDNMPENMQSGEKGTKIEEIIAALESVVESIEAASDSINECLQ
jgi:hypothetical protein